MRAGAKTGRERRATARDLLQRLALVSACRHHWFPAVSGAARECQLLSTAGLMECLAPGRIRGPTSPAHSTSIPPRARCAFPKQLSRPVRTSTCQGGGAWAVAPWRFRLSSERAVGPGALRTQDLALAQPQDQCTDLDGLEGGWAWGATRSGPMHIRGTSTCTLTQLSFPRAVALVWGLGIKLRLVVGIGRQ